MSLVLANTFKFQFRPKHDQRTYFQNLINVREYRKGNAKMENPEKLAKWGTQNTGQINVREYRKDNGNMVNSEKLEKYATQDEEKQNKNTT